METNDYCSIGDILTDETSTLITGMRSRQLFPTEPAPGCGLGREPPVSWPLSTKTLETPLSFHVKLI